MDAVILAGGKGTRLSAVAINVPKVLIKIGKKPVIEHQILLLKKNGIKNIILLLGHMGDQIKEYLGDGKKFGVNIKYFQEEEPLGTAGSLKNIDGELREDFLFISGDIMMDFDIKRFIIWHKQKKNKIASVVIHPSDHPVDSDLVQTDDHDKITSLLIRPHQQGKNFKNLGIASVFIFSPNILRYIPKNKKTDFEKDILPLVLQSGENIYGYKTPEYIKDMGTPDRLEKVNKDYKSGKIQKLNLKNKRKAIFLDRDGVINEEVGQLSNLEDFKLYDFSAHAIKKINDSEYLAIIVTNQPMIAKGFMSKEDLTEIHKKMETGLGLNGAKIDGIYYCPHHPEKGFAGEVKELKIKCNCRKPEIGLIKKAAKDFNLDLKKCIFVGDSTTDAKTAENAKIKFIGVKTGHGCMDDRCKVKKKFILYENLLEAVENNIKL